MSEPLMPKHGGYRNLKSFKVAQLAYDVTVRFCDREGGFTERLHRVRQARRAGA